MQVLTVMVCMDAVELSGTLMTDSTPIHSEFLQNFWFSLSANGILAGAPPAGVFGGRKQEDNRGQLVFN